MRGSTRGRKKGQLGFVAAIAVVLVAPALLPAAASAAPGGEGGKPAGRVDDPVVQAWVQEVGAEVVENQEALVQFRDWMQAQPEFSGSGYVAPEDDVANKATTVSWYGPRTALLGQVIAEGARRGIRVSVRPSQRSSEQLHDAMEAVWAQAHSAEWAGFTIAAVEAREGGSGALTVYGSYTSTSGALAASHTAPALPTTVNGVAIQIAAGFTSAATTGRDNDFFPFDAGGYFITPTSYTAARADSPSGLTA